MKNLLTTVFFVTASFTVGAHSVFALSALDIGGSAYNPLYIQIEQDPFQQRMQQDSQIRYQNTQLENNLKSTYGLSNFYSCSSDRSSQDLSDPHSMTQYLNTVKYCLELKSINESNTQRDTQNLEQSCKNDLGAYGKLGNVDLVNRKYSCVCQTGYNLNSTGTACVIKNTPPQNIFNSTCQEIYGVNSLYTGESYAGNTGTPTSGCGCKTGYRWNNDSTACVVPPIASVKTNDQICVDAYGASSVFTEIDSTNGKITCDCKVGYRWNQGQTQCLPVPLKKGASLEGDVAILNEQIKNVSDPKTTKQETKAKKNVQAQVVTPVSHTQEASVVGALPDTQTVKSKSLWATIRGWFGF